MIFWAKPPTQKIRGSNPSRKRAYWILPLIALFLWVPRTHAQPFDSLKTPSIPLIVATGGALVGGGLLAHSIDHRYSNSQTNYLPQKNSTFDDIFRWAPTLAHVSLHFAGIPSRSTLKRTVASRLITYAIDFGGTELLKRTIRQRRPDGSDRKSTPSGHSATAFMSAAILDREYGYLSPLVTIGGYAASTAVAFNRTIGNHHYPGDVLLGAAIGILATHAGYAISDYFLGTKPLPLQYGSGFPIYHSPSHLGFYGGYAMPLNSFTSALGHHIDQNPGLEVGIEGAYYPTKHLGLSAQASMGHFLFRQDHTAIPIWSDNLTLLSGVETSFPVTQRLNVGGKLLGGYAVQTGGRNQCRSYGIIPTEGAALLTAIHASYLLRENLDIRFQCNYKTIYANHTSRYLTPTLGLSYSF